MCLRANLSAEDMIKPELTMSWSQATRLAALWMVPLTGLVIGLILLEEWLVVTNPGFLSVVIAASVAYGVIPIIAGIIHGSSRVTWRALLMGAFAWLLSMAVALWAYTAIGGGP